MKVYIPYRTNGVGGTSTFRTYFLQQLDKENITVTCDKQDRADIFFLNTGHYTFVNLLKQKRSGVKIVQRLDGAYYPAVKPITYSGYNLKMKLAKQYWADHIIY